MRLTPIVLFGICSLRLFASAADYYVHTDGDDDANGSQSAPWSNLQDSVDKLKPGDTLHVMPGVYHEKIYINVSGAAGKPITIKGQPGAVISGLKQDDENIIYMEDKRFISIIGLELRENLKCKDGSGIRVYGSGDHIELRNNKIHKIRGKDAMGITIYGTNAEVPVSNLIIDGNEIFDCDPADSEALTLNGNVKGFQVTNNVVHDCNNIGIDFIGGEEWVTQHPDAVTRDGVCRGNRVYRCRSSYGEGYAAGIYVDSGKNIVIENNVVTECDMGIEVGAENKGCVASGITVKNNLIYRNDKAGLVFGGFEKGLGRVERCKFIGNTVYENGTDRKHRHGELWIQWADDNDVTGNTIVASAGAPLVGVDMGGVRGNRIDGNRYFTADGAEGATFLWGGEEVRGFSNWQAESKSDAKSVFGPVEVKLPPQ